MTATEIYDQLKTELKNEIRDEIRADEKLKEEVRDEFRDDDDLKEEVKEDLKDEQDNEVKVDHIKNRFRLDVERLLGELDKLQELQRNSIREGTFDLLDMESNFAKMMTITDIKALVRITFKEHLKN